MVFIGYGFGFNGYNPAGMDEGIDYHELFLCVEGFALKLPDIIVCDESVTLSNPLRFERSLPPLKKGVEGDLFNKIAPGPSFSKRGLNAYTSMSSVGIITFYHPILLN
jgi:hypothetical protein